ncbi:MAG: signal peptidase I [Spirochaetia bacterium]|nr:signal peptidase I [Spirochaetia bacterium]
MKKFYRFPRSYRNRNKVRKPVRKKDIVLLVLLCFFTYSIFSTFIIRTVRISNGSMSPAYNHGDVVLVSEAGFCFSAGNRLKRGDVVLLRPSYYREIPVYIRACDFIGRFVTLQCFSIASVMGYDSGCVIKRIIALPGDVVKVHDNVAYVQPGGKGDFISEKELGITGNILCSPGILLQRDTAPEKVDSRQYFVLSDNRDYISDSRSLDNVDFSAVKGKVLCILGVRHK